MPEYFIQANSFAAPIFSDFSFAYIKATSPADALVQFAAQYQHPCGLYAAVAHTSADMVDKGEKPLARWLSNHAWEIERARATPGTRQVISDGPGRYEVDGVPFVVADPQSGKVEADHG
mgnify:CR=1 FL=1